MSTSVSNPLVVGAAGSGASILRRWLDAHPALASGLRDGGSPPAETVIHVVRDGRDCYASHLVARAGVPPSVSDQPRAQADDWVHRTVEARSRQSRPGGFKEVRFETLVSQPEIVLRDICQFLGVAFSPCMLAALPAPGSLEASRSRIGLHRVVLSPRQRAIFESTAGGLLESLGYPTGASIAADPALASDLTQRSLASLAERDYPTACDHAYRSYLAEPNIPRATLLAQLAEWSETYELFWAMQEQVPGGPPRPCPDGSAWDGEPLGASDKLVVWKRIRDLGADIRHASMFTFLETLPCECVVETDARLIPLFARSYPRLRFVPRDPSMPPPSGGTFHATHERLGAICRPHLTAFPASNRPLRPDTGRANGFRARLRSVHGDRPVTGFSWTSGNAAKSLPTIEEWAGLLRAGGTRVVSLQHGDVAGDVGLLESLGVPVLTIPDLDLFDDLDGLAALISACDRVVTISNTTAHLAGALGIETLVVLREAPQLSWPLGAPTTVWYPTVRLEWCPPFTPWSDFLSNVSHQLAHCHITTSARNTS